DFIRCRQNFLEPVLKTGILTKHLGDSQALYPDCQLPAPTASFGLIAPFEEMNEQHFQAAFQLSRFAAAQALYLLRQVFPIESFEIAGPQRPPLFYCPSIKVAFVKIASRLCSAIGGMVRHRSVVLFRPTGN